MQRLIRTRPLHFVFASVLVLSLGLTACSPSASGGPAAPGSYDVQKSSIQFDGERYSLYWANTDGSLHRLETRDLKLVRDPDKTFLEVPSQGDPVLHLREDEPIA